MAIVSVKEVSQKFGGPAILDSVSFQIERNERVCLLGRNGEGKSTLLRCVAGELTPDGGEIAFEQGTRTAMVWQNVPLHISGSVQSVIASGLSDSAQSQQWEQSARIDKMLSQADLDGGADFSCLSGGLKRRVLLARALVCEPDLLLLDEPTNHLDLESIIWMESVLNRFSGAILFITHDRTFLKSIATRIIELDRGVLRNWDCSYDMYLERKAESLEAERKQQENFDKNLAREEAWIRRGIKARRTRNEGRVRSLLKMREERKKRREVVGDVKMTISEAGVSGKMVLETTGLGFSYTEKKLIHGLTTRILRGDKIGIIGPNGSGKTTLLKLLTGALTPTEGSLRFGVNLETIFFDQLRGQLDLEKNVWENVCDSGDTVFINGRPKHIVGYLEDFLFSRERIHSPVKQLSGGERNRVLLAKIFTRPCNMLILDEPTNDLDMDTIELLENLLVEFSGTLLLVSHDRSFVDNVVTSTLVIEPDGLVREFVGGYADWLEQKKTGSRKAEKEKAASKKKTGKKKETLSARKLSYKEGRELETLPGEIEVLEAEHEALIEKLGDPQLYRAGNEDIGALKQKLEDLEKTLEKTYARWEELEALKK